MDIRFFYELHRRDLTNLSFLKHRKFSGFIVTMHQSGTHWLKHILACAIARQLDLPPPQYAYAGDMIGGTRDPVCYPGIPLFGHSHTIPSGIITWRLLNFIVQLPRYVILVRDLRAMLVSHYEKYRQEYGCEFSEYLRGDVRNKRYVSDIWWCIRFQNAWGRTQEAFPDRCLIVKYEDLSSLPLEQLKAINQFLGLGLSEQSLIHGIGASSKEEMGAKPPKARHRDRTLQKRQVVRQGDKAADEFFNPADTEFLEETCRKYLRHDFGYR